MDTGTKKSVRSLGLFLTTAIIIGNMVGSGIFLLPSNLAANGMYAIWAWIFVSVGALLLALVFAYLTHKWPVEGGIYTYIVKTFGRFLGTQSSIIYWFYLWTGNLAIALVFASYANTFLHFSFVMENVVALALVWILIFVNINGINLYARVSSISTVLKLIPLLLVGIVGWFFIHPDYYTTYSMPLNPSVSGASAFLGSILLAMWSFAGVESASIIAPFVKNPTKNLPRATILAIVIVAVIYILGYLAMYGLIPAPELAKSSAPYSLAISMMLHASWAGILVSIFVIISTTGTLNGWTLFQGEILAKTADDGYLPKYFAKRNKKYIPARGIIITGIIQTIAIIAAVIYYHGESTNVVNEFGMAVMIATFGLLLPTFYCSLIVMILARREQRPNIAMYIVGILAGAYSIFALVSDTTVLLYSFTFVLIVSFFTLYKSKTYVIDQSTK